MFPDTDNSQTIIDCFMKAARDAGVILRPKAGLRNIAPASGGMLELTLADGGMVMADKDSA